MSEIQIADRSVGDGHPAFVIAEAGVNHNSDPKIAEKLIKGAAEAGVDAIKFQNYRAEKLVTRTAPKYYVDTMDAWEARETPVGYQYDEFSVIDKLPVDENKRMAELCTELGVLFMSTPFDEESVDLLDSLDVCAYKIASGDITSHSFLRYVAQRQRPIVLSTGCSTIGEIEEALGVIAETGNDKVALLHCTLSYPSAVEDANLNMIHTLKTVFPDKPIGLSDHTLGILVPTVAAALGATIIEKHYTIDKSLPDSTDHFMSVDPGELRVMVDDIRSAQACLGLSMKQPIPSERLSRMYARRSVVTARVIPAGTEVTEDAVLLKRPGTGIQPKDIERVLGRRVVVDVAEDTVLTWKMLG